jgi:hypothetical protein
LVAAVLTRPDRRADGWILLAVVAGTAFALARSWSYFALPPLEYEDGKHIYEYFYEQREPSPILRFKAGFLPLLPNFHGSAPKIDDWPMVIDTR